MEEIVSSEFKVRISKASLDFEQKPLAAASPAQVHRAVLHDGRLVAVKAQRPGIREQMALDLEAFKIIADMLDSYSAEGRRYRISATL